MLLFSGATVPAEVFPAGVRAVTKWMPKLSVASIFHKGSYNTLAASYESVLKYVEENGYEIAGAIRESYIDGVWNKEDESEWLTEIQVPIRKITSEET